MRWRQYPFPSPNLSDRTTVVNLLETLYVLTAGLLIAAGIQLARGKRTASRHLLWLGMLGAGVSLILYRFLRPPA